MSLTSSQPSSVSTSNMVSSACGVSSKLKSRRWVYLHSQREGGREGERRGREGYNVDGLREGEREREGGTQRSCSDQTEGTMMVGLSPALGSSSREVDTLRTAVGFLRQSSSDFREGSLQKACGPLGYSPANSCKSRTMCIQMRQKVLKGNYIHVHVHNNKQYKIQKNENR